MPFTAWAGRETWLARFSGLIFVAASAHNKKDVKTPSQPTVNPRHALKDVANRRETRKGGSIAYDPDNCFYL
jgi:hypothetical protein